MRYVINVFIKAAENKLRDTQDVWLSKEEEAIQSCTDRKDMKKFRDALKIVYGQKSSGAIPLLSADASNSNGLKMLYWKGGQNTSI